MLQNSQLLFKFHFECATVHYLLFSWQIWDFNLGRSRDHNEKAEAEFGPNNGGGFMIKSYSDMLKEISSGTTKDLEDIYDSRYGAVAEDIMLQKCKSSPSFSEHKRLLDVQLGMTTGRVRVDQLPIRQ
jgi:hypothetical protein